MRRLVPALGSLVLLALVLAAPAWAQTPGIWEEIPNTAITAALVPTGCGGNDSPASVVNAWADGDYHPPSKSFIIARTGGHADGCFNGGIAFSTETRTWRRTTERAAPFACLPTSRKSPACATRWR